MLGNENWMVKFCSLIWRSLEIEFCLQAYFGWLLLYDLNGFEVLFAIGILDFYVLFVFRD